jgi:hypothetical protein
MNKGLKEIKKLPEADKKPQIKKVSDTNCSCGCKPPPWKEKQSNQE